MGEIVEFVQHGAGRITPAVLEAIAHRLPVWKAEFTQIHSKKFPHLADQLLFLAEVVEDVYDGQYQQLPYCALAAAIFALIYSRQQVDLIPDWKGEQGLADDSSVVRAVLRLHEPAFALYAKWRRIPWNRIFSQP